MKPISDLLLISDMDGTLLTHEKQISKENLEAIRRFEKAGGHFTIATGRSAASVFRFIDLLQLQLPAIIHNGAQIYDFSTRRGLWDAYLPEESRDYVRQAIQKYPSVGVEVVAGEQIYVVNSNLYTEQHFAREKIPFVVCDLDDTPQNWYKVLFAMDAELMPEFSMYMRGKNYPGISFVQSWIHYFEMLPGHASKGQALRKLSGLTRIPLQNIVAVGDCYNDLDMLQMAGVGAAVGNAAAEVLNAADVVLRTNEEHAIAEIINMIFEEDARLQHLL